MTRIIAIFASLAFVTLAACNDPAPPKAPAAEPAAKADPAAAAPAPAEDPAVVRAKDLSEKLALAMVKLIDAGEYGSVHDNADELLRSAVTRDDFIKMTGAVIAPLGARKSIERTSATYTTTAPGAPDGKYVILQFASSFENKAAAVETITFREAEPNFWRLAGYYIK